MLRVVETFCLFAFYRMLLQRLALLGETQEREKVLFQFACRYKECNPRFLNANLGNFKGFYCTDVLALPLLFLVSRAAQFPLVCCRGGAPTRLIDSHLIYAHTFVKLIKMP